MQSQRILKSLAINPHSNNGNAVRFRLTQRVVSRAVLSLRSNLLLSQSTAETIARSLTLQQVDILNKFLPDIRDYFLNLIQIKQLTNSHDIKKSLQNLPIHFDTELKNLYDNFLANKLADKFVVTLATLVEMRELLGHNNATDAFKILSQLSESGISQVIPFAIAAKTEMAKQVVMNLPRFSEVDLDDILSVDLFETFTDLPESVRDELLTEDLLRKTIAANKQLISNRPTATELITDNFKENEKKLWTPEKRIAALGHILSAEDISLLPQVLNQTDIPEKPISPMYVLILCIAALGFIVAGCKLSKSFIRDFDQNKFISLKKSRSGRSNALFQPLPAIRETDDFTEEKAEEDQFGCTRRTMSS